MNRTLLGTLFTGISAALISQPATWAISDTNVNGIAKQITVRISNDGSAGSGVLIKREGATYTILTAAHVLTDPTSYQVRTSDGQSHSLKPKSIKIHSNADLATATFESQGNYTTAIMGQLDRLQEGMPIFVSGYPTRTAALNESIYSFSSGKLLSKAETPLREGYGLVYDNQTLPGMSGGPVLNREGQLVGIHGRADATIGVQEERLNPDVYVKSGANLGLPIQLVFSLIPKSNLAFAKSINQSLINDLWLQANFKRRQRDNLGAIATLGKIIQLDPNYIDAYNERGDIYLTMREDLSAILDFNQMVQIDPRSGEGFYNLGIAYSRSGSPKEAVASFRQAAQIFKEKKQTERYKAAIAQLKRYK